MVCERFLIGTEQHKVGSQEAYEALFLGVRRLVLIRSSVTSTSVLGCVCLQTDLNKISSR